MKDDPNCAPAAGLLDSPVRSAPDRLLGLTSGGPVMLRFLRGATHHTKTIWWELIFLTVGSFVFGFVFLLGSGIGSGGGARRWGVVGSVNGERIMLGEDRTAISHQRELYKRKYGADAGAPDQRGV